VAKLHLTLGTFNRTEVGTISESSFGVLSLKVRFGTFAPFLGVGTNGRFVGGFSMRDAA
jgi:hypothetical protein